MNPNDFVRVKHQFDPEAAPNNCLPNVERLVSRRGGEVVFGWIVGETPAYYELSHHVCWRDRDGHVWNTTPQVQLESYDPSTGQIAIVGSDILFLPDPTALFQGEELHRRPLPNRYMPKDPGNRHVREAVNHLLVGDGHYWVGDSEQGNYWTRRAEACLRRAGFRVSIPAIPAELAAKVVAG